MKIFLIVIAFAALIGGFVGGELMDNTFSLLGAVVGGVGLTVTLLGLGAFFTAQEEKKKKETLSPEIRGVFDRMLGKGDLHSISSKSRWSQRPFFKNKTKDDFMEWFSHVAPWSSLDSRITEIIVDRFNADPIFEVFVHASQELNLVSKYIDLQPLLDTEGGHIAICPRIAMILSSAAENSCSVVARDLESKKKVTDELKMHYSYAVDALESSIHIEPNFLPAYVQMALLKAMIGKDGDAKEYCMRGLERIDQLKKAPFYKSQVASIRSAHEEIADVESRIKAILKNLNI
jgi:hypothetical protein